MRFSAFGRIRSSSQRPQELGFIKLRISHKTPSSTGGMGEDLRDHGFVRQQVGQGVGVRVGDRAGVHDATWPQLLRVQPQPLGGLDSWPLARRDWPA